MFCCTVGKPVLNKLGSRQHGEMGILRSEIKLCSFLRCLLPERVLQGFSVKSGALLLVSSEFGGRCGPGYTGSQISRKRLRKAPTKEKSQWAAT